jgi:excisionase family DNA binding protein
MRKSLPPDRGSARLLNAPEAAHYLGISQRTINRLAVCGELPVINHFKYRRYDRVDLDAFIERKKVLL